jgi:hypothetical protein
VGRDGLDRRDERVRGVVPLERGRAAGRPVDDRRAELDRRVDRTQRRRLPRLDPVRLGQREDAAQAEVGDLDPGGRDRGRRAAACGEAPGGEPGARGAPFRQLGEFLLERGAGVGEAGEDRQPRVQAPTN